MTRSIARSLHASATVQLLCFMTSVRRIIEKVWTNFNEISGKSWPWDNMDTGRRMRINSPVIMRPFHYVPAGLCSQFDCVRPSVCLVHVCNPKRVIRNSNLVKISRLADVTTFCCFHVKGQRLMTRGHAELGHKMAGNNKKLEKLLKFVLKISKACVDGDHLLGQNVNS